MRVAARPRPDGLPEQRELVVRQRVDAGGEGVDVHMRFPSAWTSPRDVAKHRGGRPRGQVYVGDGNRITVDCHGPLCPNGIYHPFGLLVDYLINDTLIMR